MKPVVYYGGFQSGSPELIVGKSAWLRDLSDHPRQKAGTMVGKHVQTSNVVSIGEDGDFETLNTQYKKKK